MSLLCSFHGEFEQHLISYHYLFNPSAKDMVVCSHFLDMNRTQNQQKQQQMPGTVTLPHMDVAPNESPPGQTQGGL